MNWSIEMKFTYTYDIYKYDTNKYNVESFI